MTERRFSDYYSLLRVPSTVSNEELRCAYRAAATICHPQSTLQYCKDETLFLLLSEAYQVLSDPARRASYDRTLSNGKSPRDEFVRWQGQPALMDPLETYRSVEFDVKYEKVTVALPPYRIHWGALAAALQMCFCTSVVLLALAIDQLPPRQPHFPGSLVQEAFGNTTLADATVPRNLRPPLQTAGGWPKLNQSLRVAGSIIAMVCAVAGVIARPTTLRHLGLAFALLATTCICAAAFVKDLKAMHLTYGIHECSETFCERAPFVATLAFGLASAITALAAVFGLAAIAAEGVWDTEVISAQRVVAVRILRVLLALVLLSSVTLFSLTLSQTGHPGAAPCNVYAAIDGVSLSNGGWPAPLARLHVVTAIAGMCAAALGGGRPLVQHASRFLLCCVVCLAGAGFVLDAYRLRSTLSTACPRPFNCISQPYGATTAFNFLVATAAAMGFCLFFHPCRRNRSHSNAPNATQSDILQTPLKSEATLQSPGATDDRRLLSPPLRFAEVDTSSAHLPTPKFPESSSPLASALAAVDTLTPLVSTTADPIRRSAPSPIALQFNTPSPPDHRNTPRSAHGTGSNPALSPGSITPMVALSPRRRANLGISVEDEMDPASCTYRPMVANVISGGAGCEADIQVGDVIQKLNGETVRSRNHFAALMANCDSSRGLVLEVFRGSVGGLVDCEVSPEMMARPSPSRPPRRSKSNPNSSHSGVHSPSRSLSHTPSADARCTNYVEHAQAYLAPDSSRPRPSELPFPLTIEHL
eukprot:TRINITY_DN8500_c0_g1_i1.p1 TRINITY_DN8500_c0_g1~~TRINITY_DN8500_c0_g1_i1.p1  ORF type:complete len:758 (+),score=73.48 TRINITY_DN8500_c0_g1_i1:1410-3683(+)